MTVRTVEASGVAEQRGGSLVCRYRREKRRTGVSPVWTA